MQLKKYQLTNNEEKQNKGKTEKRGTTEAVINKYPRWNPSSPPSEKEIISTKEYWGLLPNCNEARSKQLSIEPILKTS